MSDAELVLCRGLGLLELLRSERIHLVYVNELWHKCEFRLWRYKSWRFFRRSYQLLDLSLIEETFHHSIVDRRLFQLFGISELHNDPILLCGHRVNCLSQC